MASRKGKRKQKGEFEEAFKRASKKSKQSVIEEGEGKEEMQIESIGMYDLPPEIVLQIATAGRFDPKMIALLSKVDKRFASILQDPKTRREICSQFQKQFSMLKTSEQVTNWLRREIESQQSLAEQRPVLHPVSIIFGKSALGTAITAFCVYWDWITDIYLVFESVFHFHKNLLGTDNMIGTVIGYDRRKRIDITPLSFPSYVGNEHFWNDVKSYFQREMPGISFGTKIVDQKLKNDKSVRLPIQGSKMKLWFDEKENGSDYWLISPGRLVDDSAWQHPYCRDL